MYKNSKNNNEGATLYLKGHGYYSEATRDNMKEADCAERDTGAEQLRAEHLLCCLVWLSLAPGEGSVTDCYSTTCHPHIQQYIRSKKQTNTDDMERIKCDSNGGTSKGCNFTRAGKDLIVPQRLMV
jgi:hypothetical protein